MYHFTEGYVFTQDDIAYAEDSEIEKRIEEVSAEIEANKLDEESDPKPSKRPRKTRL